MLMDDFGELARYRDANAALQPPAAGENRVVFFGDSITDLWKLDVSFPGKPYVNRGISGQTTPQLLIRLRPDVIELRPKVVVILAGTNDIAGNTGPESLEEVEGNYASMAELARAHDIKVVFSSVLPVHEYTAEQSAEKLICIAQGNEVRRRNARQRAATRYGVQLREFGTAGTRRSPVASDSQDGGSGFKGTVVAPGWFICEHGAAFDCAGKAVASAVVTGALWEAQ
jgi:lysophospholipase L1-like esterase